MITLHIQHVVSSFEAWKQAFDRDPVGRKAGGVRGHRVQRSVADLNFVMIDLEFDTVEAAEQFLLKLRQLWNGPAKAIMRDPAAWVVETVEVGPS